MDFGLTWKIRKKSPKKRKNRPKKGKNPIFGRFFLSSGDFFPIFQVRPKSIFETDFLPGRQDCKTSVSCSRLISKSETWVPKRGGLKPAGKRQESAKRSDFDVAVQFFVCCSAAFGKNRFGTAEKRMLQCNFCSAAFRKLQRNFRFRLWHVTGVGFRGVGFRIFCSIIYSIGGAPAKGKLCFH